MLFHRKNVVLEIRVVSIFPVYLLFVDRRSIFYYNQAKKINVRRKIYGWYHLKKIAYSTILLCTYIREYIYPFGFGSGLNHTKNQWFFDAKSASKTNQVWHQNQTKNQTKKYVYNILRSRQKLKQILIIIMCCMLFF